MIDSKDILITFEEKIPLSELTERERQAYERGRQDGISNRELILYMLPGVMIGMVIGVFVMKFL